jgi:hypothetical protein
LTVFDSLVAGSRGRVDGRHRIGLCGALVQSLISDRPDRDLPPFPVTSVCPEWDEPAALDQNFGQFERALPILSDIGPVTINIARANGGFGPSVLEPVEQYSYRRGSWQRSRRGRWRLWRSSLFQSFKYVLGRHRRRPFSSSKLLRPSPTAWR